MLGHLKNIYFPVTNLIELWGAHMKNQTISAGNPSYNYALPSEKDGINLLHDYIYALRGFPESKLKNPSSFLFSRMANKSVEKFTTRNSIDYVHVLIEDAFHER